MQHLTRHLACALAMLLIGGALAERPAQADTLKVSPSDVGTVFFIGKSDDRNQVHYGIRLDPTCKPVGTAPIFIYWQQIERSPTETSALSFLDGTVYGIRKQSVDLPSGDESARVSFSLEAATKRKITFVMHKDGDHCVAEAHCALNGVPARLERIYVKLASFFRVDYLDLFGTEEAGAKPIVERAHP